MSNNLGLDPAVIAAANAALTEFVNKTPAFYNTVENCRALQNFLKSKNVTIEYWGDGPRVFAAAFWECSQADAQFPLEAAPTPKTQDQINAEKAAKDLRDGSYAANRPGAKQQPTQTSKREELAATEAKTRAAEIKAAHEAELAKVEKDNDLTIVPTVDQILDSQQEGGTNEVPFAWNLSGRAANSWSRQQLALYFKNSRKAQESLDAAATEARAKRIAERQRLGL